MIVYEKTFNPGGGIADSFLPLIRSILCDFHPICYTISQNNMISYKPLRFATAFFIAVCNCQ